MFKLNFRKKNKIIILSLIAIMFISIGSFSAYATYGLYYTTYSGIYHLDVRSNGFYAGNDYIRYGGDSKAYTQILTIKSDYTSSYQYIDSSLYINNIEEDSVNSSETNTSRFNVIKNSGYVDHQYNTNGKNQVFSYHRADYPNGSLASYSSTWIYE